jgi:hypothetical protein
MKGWIVNHSLVVFFVLGFALTAAVADTMLRDLVLGEGLPAKIKSKKHVARWDQIDQVLNRTVMTKIEGLPERMKAKAAPGELGDVFSEKFELQKRLAENGILFSDLFQIDDENLFPLTNSVVKLVPEASLEGVTVYDKSGTNLGAFAGKTRYERSGGLYTSRSYTLITFQYKTPKGDFQSAGNANLLDNFLVRWRDIKGRPALDLSFLVSS